MRSTGAPDSLKEQLLTNYKTADISDFEKLMLGYVEKITVDPSSIDQDYIDGMRMHGFDDRTLHDIVQVAAYFAYINRLADALGVELE